MKNKKIMLIVLSLLLVLSLLSACTKPTPTTTSSAAPPSEQTDAEKDTDKAESTDAVNESNTNEPDADVKDPLKVVYLVNGNLGDKGFYDNAAAGFYRLRDELGCEIKIIEMGRDETSYEGYFLDESEKDWDLIVAGTWSVKELAEEIALKYPDQKYLFFDGAVNFDKVTTKNMMGVTYQSNETAYMAGALAALMLDADNEKVDDTKRLLGFVGSIDSPNINDFLIGYIEGIKYIDPEIKLLTSYVGSFEDVPKCLEMTNQLYNQGAQLVYAPASQSMLGAVQSASDLDKLFIACDNDVWGMMEADSPELVENVVSSSMKHIGDSIFNAVSGLMDGTYDMGENYTLGIKDGAVGLAKNDNYVAIVPESLRTQLDEIADKISTGEIKVGTAFGMDTAEVAEIRDNMKP